MLFVLGWLFRLTELLKQRDGHFVRSLSPKVSHCLTCQLAVTLFDEGGVKGAWSMDLQKTSCKTTLAGQNEEL